MPDHRDIRTRHVGYAPDERGTFKPPEIVYACEKPPNFWQRLWRLPLAWKIELACAIFMFSMTTYLVVAVWVTGDERAFWITAMCAAYFVASWFNYFDPNRPRERR